MKTLIINTALKDANLVLVVDNKRYFMDLPNDRMHSDTLLPVMEELLVRHNISLNDLDNICVITGPGSFTGLRIGLSTVKAFNKVLKCKFFALSVFDVLKNIEGVVLTSCTKTSYYYSVNKKGKILQTGVIKDTDITTLKGKKYVLEGDFDGEKVLDFKLDMTSRFLEEISSGNSVDISTVEPLYIEVAQAER